MKTIKQCINFFHHYFATKKAACFSTLLGHRVVVISSQHLGGVLSALRNKTTLNKYLDEFVATESTSWSGTPKEVFSPDTNTYWQTAYNPATQWIQIEMKNKYITMTGYVIQTPNVCCGYPRTWYLEGKNSNSSQWKRIDSRTDISEMNKKSHTMSFKNNILKKCTFKIFRFTQIVNWYGDKYLSLNEMDFMGALSNTYKKQTIRCITII